MLASTDKTGGFQQQLYMELRNAGMLTYAVEPLGKRPRKKKSLRTKPHHFVIVS